MQETDTPTGEIELRYDLRPGDIGFVLYLHGILYARERGYDRTYEGYVAESLAQFALSYDPQKDRLWVVELDERIVGSIGVVGRSDTEAQLRWYLLHTDCRGRGVGQKLMEEALQFCRARGFKTVFLWTVSDLQAARRIYEAYGFQKVEATTHEIWGQLLTEEKYNLNL